MVCLTKLWVFLSWKDEPNLRSLSRCHASQTNRSASYTAGQMTWFVGSLKGRFPSSRPWTPFKKSLRENTNSSSPNCQRCPSRCAGPLTATAAPSAAPILETGMTSAARATWSGDSTPAFESPLSWRQQTQCSFASGDNIKRGFFIYFYIFAPPLQNFILKLRLNLFMVK